MVDDLNLVLELSGFGGSLGPCGFSLCFLDSAVLLATVTLSCVAPLFYTALPKLIKAYFTLIADTLSALPRFSPEHLVLQTL